MALMSPQALANEENLTLKTPLPVSIATNTLEVELEPKISGTEFRFDGTTVSICEEKIEVCGSSYDTEPGTVRAVKVNGDNYGKKVYVLNINENKIVFNFTSIGKFQVTIAKRYSKDVPGRSVRDTFYSKINIPIEIKDIKNGGISLRDLKTAGIQLHAFPILGCPNKVKNTNQKISCDLSYAYEKQDYNFLIETFEIFIVCAYKTDNSTSDCDGQNPYFKKEVKIKANSNEKIKIPIYKNFDTSIYMQSLEGGYTTPIYYSNKPVKVSTNTKSKSSPGKWVRKCKTIRTSIIPQPGELTDSVLNGSGESFTKFTQVCENVWVP